LKEQQQQLIEAAAANANAAKDIGVSLQEQLKQVHIKICVYISFILFQVKEAELQFQIEKENLLLQLHSKEQEQIEQRRQQLQLSQHNLEQGKKHQELQLQLEDIRQQFATLQSQHLKLQQQADIDSTASSLTLSQLKEQLLAAQESQSVEASAVAAALESNKLVQSELQAARDRIKYLETAVSGHVTRLQSQAIELSGSQHRP
jgi:hypothetical protein